MKENIREREMENKLKSIKIKQITKIYTRLCNHMLQTKDKNPFTKGRISHKLKSTSTELSTRNTSHFLFHRTRYQSVSSDISVIKMWNPLHKPTRRL